MSDQTRDEAKRKESAFLERHGYDPSGPNRNFRHAARLGYQVGWDDGRAELEQRIQTIDAEATERACKAVCRGCREQGLPEDDARVHIYFGKRTACLAVAILEDRKP